MHKAAREYLDYILETYPPTSGHEERLRRAYEREEQERPALLLHSLIERFPVLDLTWTDAVQAAWWRCYWRLWDRVENSRHTPEYP